MSNIGKSIFETFQFVSRVGSECDQLAKLLKQEISGLIASDDEVSASMQADGHWIDSVELDEGKWVTISVAYSLPIKVRPKRTAHRYLTFQISLSGAGVGAHDNDHPLVHVAWWESPINFQETRDFEESWMGFPFDIEEDYHAYSLEAGVLFRWPSENTWLYSLRLTSLNTIRDVETKIVTPVKKPLCGSTVEDALPPTLEGLVHYAEVDGQPGHFRVEA